MQKPRWMMGGKREKYERGVQERMGGGFDTETDPNKTICRVDSDDETRCLIKGAIANFFLNHVGFLAVFSSCAAASFGFHSQTSDKQPTLPDLSLRSTFDPFQPKTLCL